MEHETQPLLTNTDLDDKTLDSILEKMICNVKKENEQLSKEIHDAIRS